MAAVVFALFVSSVHLGVEVVDPEAGTFRSRYDAATLFELSRARTDAWRVNSPPTRPRSLSREDQYQSEGHLHVAERNRQWSAGNYEASWSENLVLEKYYAPVLDAPSFLSKTGHRWPEQRADGEQRVRGLPSAQYVSMADATGGRHFIRAWPRPTFLVIALATVAAILGVTISFDRRWPRLRGSIE